MFRTNPTQSKANSYLLLSCFPTGQVLQPSEGRQSLSHQISSDITLTGSPNTVCKDPSVPSQFSLTGWRGPRWDPKWETLKSGGRTWKDFIFHRWLHQLAGIVDDLQMIVTSHSTWIMSRSSLPENNIQWSGERVECNESFLRCFQDSLFFSLFWQFDCDVSKCGPLWVCTASSLWSFLDVEIWCRFSSHLRSLWLFLQISFLPLFFLSSSPKILIIHMYLYHM